VRRYGKRWWPTFTAPARSASAQAGGLKTEIVSDLALALAATLPAEPGFGPNTKLISHLARTRVRPGALRPARGPNPQLLRIWPQRPPALRAGAAKRCPPALSVLPHGRAPAPRRCLRPRRRYDVPMQPPANLLRAGMVGLGRIFDDTYRPCFAPAQREGLYRRQCRRRRTPTRQQWLLHLAGAQTDAPRPPGAARRRDDRVERFSPPEASQPWIDTPGYCSPG